MIRKARAIENRRNIRSFWLAAATAGTLATMLPSMSVAQATAQTPAKSPLANRIQSIVDRPEFRHAFFGIEVYSLDSGKPVYEMNSDKLFVPGSTTKLLTMGTALSLLGPDFRFHTRVYRTGPIGADGTLDGDVVLVASGDPNLSARVRPDGTLAFENEDHAYDGSPDTKAVPGDPLLVIREIARQIAAHGVKHVRGRVLVDATLFEGGDRELGTGTVISPVVVNDNLVDLMIGGASSAGAQAVLTSSPATSYVRFVNAVTTGAPDSQPHVRFSSDVTGADGTHTVTVSGSTPAGKPAILYSYAVPDPPLFAEFVLTEALHDAGVLVDSAAGRRSGQQGQQNVAPDFKAIAASYTPDHMVAEHVSPQFKEEVKVTLKVSQNLHASMTPRMLRAVLAPRDTGKTGFDLEHDFLTKAGLDLTGAQQADGAGGDAHFTPRLMVGYLAYMNHQKNSADFYNALPILGRDGTLWNVQTSSPAAGHVHAKTGTFQVYDPLNRALLVTGKGLAGYVTTADGRHLAVAIYVNNVSVPLTPDAVTAIVGQALGEIAAAAYEGP